MDISKYIDYTLLEPTATERNVIDLCYTAKKNNFHAICVNSSYVALARQLLEHTDVKVCSVIGFPLGSMATASKVYEAKQAVSDGADEIDMVINIGFLKSKNYVSVLKDISDVKICASGGINDAETAKKYIDIGVSKISVSSEFKIKQTAL